MCSECSRLLAVLLVFDHSSAGGGLREEAGSCPRCWTRVEGGGRGRRRGQILHPRPPLVMNRRAAGHRRKDDAQSNITVVDATLKLAAHRSHVCHHKPRVDDCTQRLYNSEMGCCPTKQHTCNITWCTARMLFFFNLKCTQFPAILLL